MAATAGAERTNKNADMKSLDDCCRREAPRSLGMQVDEEKRQDRGSSAASKHRAQAGVRRVEHIVFSMSNEDELGRVTPRKLFQEAPELMTDEEHTGEKTMSDSSEPEWMTVRKGFMKTQAVGIKGQMAEQGKRIGNAERVLHDSRKEKEKRLSTVETQLNDIEGKHAATIQTIEERLNKLELGQESKDPATAATNGYWQPRQVILGGWADTAPMETLPAEVRGWLEIRSRPTSDPCCESHTSRSCMSR